MVTQLSQETALSSRGGNEPWRSLLGNLGAFWLKAQVTKFLVYIPLINALKDAFNHSRYLLRHCTTSIFAKFRFQLYCPQSQLWSQPSPGQNIHLKSKQRSVVMVSALLIIKGYFEMKQPSLVKYFKKATFQFLSESAPISIYLLCTYSGRRWGLHSHFRLSHHYQ